MNESKYVVLLCNMMISDEKECNKQVELTRAVLFVGSIGTVLGAVASLLVLDALIARAALQFAVRQFRRSRHVAHRQTIGFDVKRTDLACTNSLAEDRLYGRD